MRKLGMAGLVAVAFSLTACSAATMRMVEDSLYEAQGYTVTYYDQDYSFGDHGVICYHGVKNNRGYYYFRNTTGRRQHIVLKLDDNSTRNFYLEPYQTTSRVWVAPQVSPNSFTNQPVQ